MKPFKINPIFSLITFAFISLNTSCPRSVTCPGFPNNSDANYCSLMPHDSNSISFKNEALDSNIVLYIHKDQSYGYFADCNKSCYCNGYNIQHLANYEKGIEIDLKIDVIADAESDEDQISNVNYDLYYSVNDIEYKTEGLVFNWGSVSSLRTNYQLNDSVSVGNTFSLIPWYNYPDSMGIQLDSLVIQYQQGLVAFWVGDTLWMRDDV